MRYRTFISLTVLVLFLFSAISFISPMARLMPPGNDSIAADERIVGSMPGTSQAPSLPPPPTGPSWDGNEFLYEGLGSTLDTTEYAYGLNSSSIYNLTSGTPQYGEITHPTGWTGYELTAGITNLMDNNTWIDADTRNGDFEQSWTDWSYTSNGLGSQTSNPYHGRDWDFAYGNPGRGVIVWINHTAGTHFETTDYSAFEQTFTLSRYPEWARLTFDVKLQHSSGATSDRDELAIYVEVGGETYLLAIGYYLDDIGGGDSNWETITLPIPYDHVQQWGAPGSLNIKLGLGYIVEFDSYSAQWWAMLFDNVELEIKGKAQPADSTIGLQLNSTAVTNGASYGTGSVILSGPWTNPGSTYQMDVEWKVTASAGKQVEFDYELRLYATKTDTTEQVTGPDGTVFSVRNQSASVYWTAWYYVSSPIPGIYHQYNLTLDHPSGATWTKYEITNPLGEDRTTAVTDNGTHFLLTPTTIGSVFGWWNFTFISPNQVTSIDPISSTYYISPHSPNSLSFNAYFGVTTGEANCTIYYPDGSIATSDDGHSLGGSPSVSFGPYNFNDGNIWTVGTYTLCVSYDNGDTPDQTAAGFYSEHFTIVHDTTLTPEQTSLQVTQGPSGFFYPRVQFTDADRSDLFIGNTTGTVKVNGTVDGNPIDFYQAGSWYEAKIANSLLAVGDYVLTVDASESYYEDAQTTIDLEVRSDATLTSPESPGLTIPYDETFTVQVFYEDEFSNGIAGATVTTDWPTSPIGTGNGTDGWYNILIDTADQTGPGTYSLTIQAERNYYTTRTLVLTIVVREIYTTLDYTPPGSVPWGEDVVIDLDLSVNDPESGHDGNGIGSASFSLQMDGSPLTEGVNYTLSNLGGGQYRITLLASSCEISTIKGYILLIQADPTDPMYGDASRSINFDIRELRTVILYTPPQPVPFGGDVIIVLTYQVDDVASSRHNGDGIPGVPSITGTTLDLGALNPGDYTFVDDGGGQYTLTILFTSGLISQIKSYDLALHLVSPSANYEDGDRDITFSVRALFTQITYDPPEPTPWGEDVVIIFYYTVSDPDSTQHGNGITGVTSISGTTLDAIALNPGEYTLTPNGGGQYTLTILYTSGKINNIKSYSLALHVVTPSNLYEDSDRTIAFDVRTISTLIRYIPSPPVPRGTDVVLTFYFEVNDPASSQHGNGITGVTSIAGSLLESVALNPGEYSLTPVGGGQYTLTILYTSGKISAIQTYTLDLHVVSPDSQHDDADQSIDFEIRKVRTAITYDAVGSTAWGFDVVITFNFVVDDSASGEDGNGIPGVSSIAGTMLDGLALNPGEYSLTPVGGGQYTLTILYTSGKISAVKTYSLALHAVSPDIYHEDADQTIGFSIRNHYIASDIDPITSIPWDNPGTMTLRVDDDDESTPLPDADLKAIEIVGPTTVYYDLSNWTTYVTNGTANDGIWVVSFDPTGWSIATHSLVINIYTSSSYDNDVVNTAATIRPLATSFTYQSPPVVPWSEDGTLVVKYIVSDPVAYQDGDDITGGTILISGLTPVTDFTFVDNMDGTYTITFDKDTVLTSVGSYQFDITIQSPAQYSDGQLDAVPMTVRALFTWLHPSDIPLTPFGDDVVLYVAYEVLDGESSFNGQPINEGTEVITVTGLDGFSLTPADYSYAWVGAQLVYRITIDASVISDIGEYKIMISISGSGAMYEPDMIPELTFNVRTVFTAMTLEPVDAEAYLENFTIRITYIVNDPESTNNGNGIDGQEAIIEITEYVGFFDVIPFGGGIYEIVINSTFVGAPGAFPATVNTSWPTTPPPYAVQTKQTTLFVLERPTDIRNTPVGEYGYTDEILVNFTYSDQDRSEWITNTSYGGDHVFVILYNMTDATPIPTEAWYIVDLTGGDDAFQLAIDADYFGIVNTFFDFKVDITWQIATAPYFEAQEFEFRAYVVGPQTTFIREPSQGATPWGLIINFTFKYQTEQGLGIDETIYPDVAISVLCEEVPSFGTYLVDWWYTNLGGGRYEVHIYSTVLGDTGLYTFYVNVTYPGGLSPYFESQYNRPVSEAVRNLNTILSYDPPPTIFWGDNITLLVRYWDHDNQQHVPDIPTAVDLTVTSFAGVPITSSYIRLPSGLYQSWFNITIESYLLDAGQYVTIQISANQSYYVFQNIQIEIYIYELPLRITLLTPPVIDMFYGETPEPVVRVTVEDIYSNPISDAIVEALSLPVIYTSFSHIGGGTYECTLSTLYDKDRYPIEIRASGIGFYANDSEFITFTIIAGPSTLIPYNCEFSFILYPPAPYFIAVNYTTTAGVPLEGADVTWSSSDLSPSSGTFNEITPGIYRFDFDSTDYGFFIYTIDVTASIDNVQTQRRTFQIDVRFTPAKILPEEGYVIIADYFDSFIVTVFLNDTLSNQPIPGQDILATWDPLGTVIMTDLGGGYYSSSFPATLAAGFSYSLYLDFIGPGSYDCQRVTLTIEIKPRPTSPADQMDILSVRDQWNKTIESLQIPVGDWLYIYLNYTDINGVPIPDGEGLVRVGDVAVEGAFGYDPFRNLYVVMLNASQFGRGSFSLRVTVSKTNFDSVIYTTNFEIISIPTELIVTEIDGYPVYDLREWTFYIGNPASIRLYLNDTWHNSPIDNATFSIPSSLVSEGFVIVALGNGIYELRGTWTAFSFSERPVTLLISAEKTEPLRHETAQLEDWFILFTPHEAILFAVYGGIGAAVALVFVLLSWILYVRVLSIPWEVRRMRKLAKTLEKEEGFKLNRKDRKRFREREVSLEDTVDKAMSTVGVSATPAMIPRAAVVDEVTATEEDILGELDKIPGLGPEEKAVLAEEMRKIPRKDRIWFLDDLQRQMSERRMDFITKREPAKVEPAVKVKPDVKPKAKPKPKAKVKPEPKPEIPLEEVEPVEPPPPDKALKEERIAPTVKPPEFVPPPVPEGVESEIRQELDRIPGLSDEEKKMLVDHLKRLTKEERQATYNSLRQTADEE